MLEISPNRAGKTPRIPAVSVVGNLEGAMPIASEAAMYLVYQLIENEETRKDLTWYLLVSGNPDGAAHLFAKPVFAGGRLLDPYKDQVNYKEFRPEIQMLQVPGNGKVGFQFLVSGEGTLTFDYESRKAGKLRKTVELKSIK